MFYFSISRRRLGQGQSQLVNCDFSVSLVVIVIVALIVLPIRTCNSLEIREIVNLNKTVNNLDNFSSTASPNSSSSLNVSGVELNNLNKTLDTTIKTTISPSSDKNLTNLTNLTINKTISPIISHTGEDLGDTSTEPEVEVSTSPLVIVISFDGFRYNYFGRSSMPNMDSIRSNGVYVRYMLNQFITKTFPNHQSIATGLYTESHGVIDNWLFDPKYNETLGEENGPEEAEKLWNFSDQVLPAWIVNQNQGHSSGVMMWPGGGHYYGANYRPKYFVNWNASIEWSWRVDKSIEWISSRGVNLVYMYFEEPDEVAHGFGPESPQVKDQIDRIDQTMGYLIDKLKLAGLFERVNLVLLSDHGFQEVKYSNMINITKILEPLAKKGVDYKVYGSTPVLQILPTIKNKTTDLYNALKNGEQNYQVYLKENLPGHWHLSNNRRVMPILLVADLGFVFDDFQNSITSYDKKYNRTASPNNTYGVHGYDNNMLPMHPFFIGHGPAFKEGVEVQDVFENIDVFPLVCHILQLSNSPKVNGTLTRIKGVLKENSHTMGFGKSFGWIVFGLLCIGLAFLLGFVILMLVRKRQAYRRPLVEEFGYKYINGDRKHRMNNNLNKSSTFDELLLEETILEEDEEEEVEIFDKKQISPTKHKKVKVEITPNTTTTTNSSSVSSSSQSLLLNDRVLKDPSKPEECQALLNTSSNEELS